MDAMAIQSQRENVRIDVQVAVAAAQSLFNDV
jgi:hypothetical protein